jgi:hypothetical protein
MASRPRATMSNVDEEIEADISSIVIPDIDIEELATQEEVEEIEEDDEEEPGSLNVEDLDPNTEIWPSGPTAAQTVAWKDQYGDIYVTSVTMEKHVMWRTLNRLEYKQVVKQIEKLMLSDKYTQSDANMYNEEIICEICTLHPKLTRSDFNHELAGLPAILSQQILEASGFTSIDVRQM